MGRTQRETSKRFYDLSDKERKNYAKLRSNKIDNEFTKIVTQYLHFMNKYQKNILFRHKNDFNFRLIDQGPLKGIYIGEVTAAVYSKSGDYIQDKFIGGRYYLFLDHESYYSNDDYKSRTRQTWNAWVSDLISRDCEKYFLKIEYNKIKDRCDQTNFPELAVEGASEDYVEAITQYMCLSRHNPNYEKEQKKYCETLVKNINSSYKAFSHSYYMSIKNSSNYEIWTVWENDNERIEDNMLHNSIFYQ